MKYYHLERFPVRLTTLSPLFIGGGNETRMDNGTTVYLSKEQKLLIPNLDKLMIELSRLGLLDAFEAFLQNRAGRSLAEFLYQCGVPASPSSPWMAYSVECSEKTINTLKLFVKNPELQPYIPGSSVKGAMRTAMLASLMNDFQKETLLRETDFARNRHTSKTENLLRRDLQYNTRNSDDAVNDLFRGIAISDSAPLGKDALFVGKKQDMKPGRSDSSAGKIPLLRECLRPGTDAELMITLDTSIFPYSRWEQLKKALSNRDRRLQEIYDSKFDLYADFPSLPRGACPITLGAGTGFQTKSLLSAFRNQDEGKARIHFVLKGQFPKYKCWDPSQPAPYCFKAIEYHNRLYPYGRCALFFDEK